MLRMEDGVDVAGSLYLYCYSSAWPLRPVIVVPHVLWNLKGMIRRLCLVQTSWWRDRCGVGAQVLSPVRLVVMVAGAEKRVVGDGPGAVGYRYDVDRGIFVAVQLTEGRVVVVGMVLWGQRQRTCSGCGSAFSLLFVFSGCNSFLWQKDKRRNVFATRLEENKGRDGPEIWVYYEEGNYVNGLEGGSACKGPQEVIDGYEKKENIVGLKKNCLHCCLNNGKIQSVII